MLKYYNTLMCLKANDLTNNKSIVKMGFYHINREFLHFYEKVEFLGWQTYTLRSVRLSNKV